MLTENDIYWLASMQGGWTASVDFSNQRDGVRWVFLERGTQRHSWGPVGAVQRLSVEEFFAYLEGLDCEPLGQNL